ncbi:hypothetical protein O181_133142 [Austropuccinia psidii MF-1]|uniref:Uncharacterized protein n=1 Tax=Austropuccinia psidii MF-1 TaxID=1389203 RepID=A0A9Q3L699_9BASI|nr:hypothetical protein [Austropuccinia psidii MF-1]
MESTPQHPPMAISCRNWPPWPISTSPTPRSSSLILGLGGQPPTAPTARGPFRPPTAPTARGPFRPPTAPTARGPFRPPTAPTACGPFRPPTAPTARGPFRPLLA